MTAIGVPCNLIYTCQNFRTVSTDMPVQTAISNKHTHMMESIPSEEDSFYKIKTINQLFWTSRSR